MPNALATPCCPDRDTWSGFYAGKADPDSVVALAEHLEHCSSCQNILSALAASTVDEADALVAELRAVAPEADAYEGESECRLALERVQSLVPGTEAPPPVPEQLGEYRIVGLLGRGGMGAVYRATHVRLGREVALKIVSPERVRAASSARFEREMLAHGKLDHPNVVRATDAGEVNGIAFLVMDLVDGVSLEQLVRTRGAMTVADACAIARQAAIGLEHLAGHGLVHRDVKPSNLMLNRQGVVKVLDLGLAATVDLNKHDTSLTSEGQVVGTFDYLAPEQAEHSGSIDVRADIYSLGCSLYYLLTGKPPYNGSCYATSRAKILAHIAAPVPQIRTARPEVPPELAAVLARMMAKKPAERFATPAEVAEALGLFCAGSDLASLFAPSVKTQRAKPAPPNRRPRRTPPLIAFAVLVLLLLGGGLSAAIKFWFLPSREPVPAADDSDTKQHEPPAPEPKEPRKDEPKEDPKEEPKPDAKMVHPVALLSFEERGVGAKDMGPKVGDLLFAKLVAKPDFYLVDRTDLKKVLDEQQLNLTGAVKADEAVKVGQLTGAKILVTGSVIQADKKLYLVAKIISTESGRVFGASVEGAMSDELGILAGKLADAIDETVGKQGEKLVSKPAAAVDRIAALNKKLDKAVRPVLWIAVNERHIGPPAAAPAAQTEIARIAKGAGFELIDTEEGAKSKADVVITGEGFSEVAGRVGGLVSVRARVELKAVDRRNGKVLATDRQTVLLVDVSEQVAAKTAIQNAAADLAERILPKVIKAEKK